MDKVEKFYNEEAVDRFVSSIGLKGLTRGEVVEIVRQELHEAATQSYWKGYDDGENNERARVKERIFGSGK